MAAAPCRSRTTQTTRCVSSSGCAGACRKVPDTLSLRTASPSARCPLFADDHEEPIRFCACTRRESDTRGSRTPALRGRHRPRGSGVCGNAPFGLPLSRCVSISDGALNSSIPFPFGVYLEFYNFTRCVRSSCGVRPAPLPQPGWPAIVTDRVEHNEGAVTQVVPWQRPGQFFRRCTPSQVAGANREAVEARQHTDHGDHGKRLPYDARFPRSSEVSPGSAIALGILRPAAFRCACIPHPRWRSCRCPSWLRTSGISRARFSGVSTMVTTMG